MIQLRVKYLREAIEAAKALKECPSCHGSLEDDWWCDRCGDEIDVGPRVTIGPGAVRAEWLQLAIAQLAETDRVAIDWRSEPIDRSKPGATSFVVFIMRKPDGSEVNLSERPINP